MSFWSGAPDFLNDLRSLPYARAIWIRVERDVTLLIPARDLVATLGLSAISAGLWMPPSRHG